MRELDGGKDDVHLSPYSRAKRERMSALAALAVPDAILVSFYSSRLRLASPLAQRRRDRDSRGRPALPFLYLRLYLGFPEIREEPNRVRRCECSNCETATNALPLFFCPARKFERRAGRSAVR